MGHLGVLRIIIMAFITDGVAGPSTTLCHEQVTPLAYVGYWVRRSKYENSGVFVFGHPGISHIIRCLTGGVIDVYGPSPGNYTGG